MHLHLAHLYPRSMNTYGDTGNITCLKQRCTWRDIDVTIHEIEQGDPLPPVVDLYFFGGGQDAAQNSLTQDLQTKAERIRNDIHQGIPLLAICGGYQLLGHSYHPFDQEPLTGIGLFPVETHASHDRMIGNLVIEVDKRFSENLPHTVVGFENHSGKTTLLHGATPFGQVTHGFGNNGSDKTEGCVVNNAIGCYLHGSLLPKNPHIADWLILQACRRYNSRHTLQPLDDELEWQAHAAITGRYP
jgi:CobQ-like glutamine amidotransferase family enzyme